MMVMRGQKPYLLKEMDIMKKAGNGLNDIIILGALVQEQFRILILLRT